MCMCPQVCGHVPFNLLKRQANLVADDILNSLFLIIKSEKTSLDIS